MVQAGTTEGLTAWHGIHRCAGRSRWVGKQAVGGPACGAIAGAAVCMSVPARLLRGCLRLQHTGDENTRV